MAHQMRRFGPSWQFHPTAGIFRINGGGVCEREEFSVKSVEKRVSKETRAVPGVDGMNHR